MLNLKNYFVHAVYGELPSRGSRSLLIFGRPRGLFGTLDASYCILKNNSHATIIDLLILQFKYFPINVDFYLQTKNKMD